MDNIPKSLVYTSVFAWLVAACCEPAGSRSGAAGPAGRRSGTSMRWWSWRRSGSRSGAACGGCYRSRAGRPPAPSSPTSKTMTPESRCRRRACGAQCDRGWATARAWGPGWVVAGAPAHLSSLPAGARLPRTALRFVRLIQLPPTRSGKSFRFLRWLGCCAKARPGSPSERRRPRRRASCPRWSPKRLRRAPPAESGPARPASAGGTQTAAAGGSGPPASSI